MLEARVPHLIKTPLGPIFLGRDRLVELYDAVVLGLNPVAYWPFHETSGATFPDETGNGHTGTWIAEPTRGAFADLMAPENNAPTLPGAAGNGASVAAHADFHNPPLTIEAWLKPGTTGPHTSHIILNSLRTSDYAEGSWQLAWEEDSGGYVYGSIAGGTIIGDSLVSPTAADELAYMALTISATTAELYLNGVKVAEETITYPNNDTPRIVYFGRGNVDVGAFDGEFDQIAVYPSVLSAEDILFNYRLGSLVVNGTTQSFLTAAPVRDLPVRGINDPLPQGTGAVIGDKYEDAAIWTLAGVLHADDHASMQVEAQRIRGLINRLLRADGEMIWLPSGFEPLTSTVRRHERPEVGNGRGLKKNVLLSLISGDPRVYQRQPVTVDLLPVEGVGFAEPIAEPIAEGFAGDTTTIENAGDADTPPVLRFYGPGSSFTLQCVTNGDATTYASEIPDGEFVEIDVANGTVYQNGSDYADRYEYIHEDTDLHEIPPEESEWQFIVSDAEENTRCEVIYRPAWMP